MLQRKEKPLRTSNYGKSLNRQEEYVWYRGIPGLISFSTILPLNIHTSIAEMARYTVIWPFIGGLIGVLVGVVGLLLSNYVMLPSLVTASLIYSFAIWFTGFHHLDGLMDLGDALMAHGTPERKIEIMRDMRIGTGGIALFFMVALTTVAVISSIPIASIFFVLLISEIAAKMGLVSCCTISRPIGNGTGRHFIEAMNPLYLILMAATTTIIGFLSLNVVGLIGIISGILGGFLVAVVVRINMKYATGDVLGASNEVARMAAILAMIMTFKWI